MNDDLVTRLREIAGKYDEYDAHSAIEIEAADEIERLRAGGCARDQRLTQHCAEAEALRVENERLRAALGGLLAASERHIFSDECKAQRDAARAALAKEQK